MPQTDRGTGVLCTLESIGQRTGLVALDGGQWQAGTERRRCATAESALTIRAARQRASRRIRWRPARRASPSTGRLLCSALTFTAPTWPWPLNNLSVRLGQASKPEDALAAVHESVSIRRELRPLDDREILHGLAASLRNLGIRLRVLDRHEEAAVTAREAVAVCRQLASQEAAYRVRLADALNGLAIAEAELGHLAASAEAATEAVMLLRELHEGQPAAYRRRLVSALTNCGRAVRASDTGVARSLLDEARGLCDRAADAELIQLIDEILADGPGPK